MLTLFSNWRSLAKRTIPSSVAVLSLGENARCYGEYTKAMQRASMFPENFRVILPFTRITKNAQH
jgi:hypothetical protein